MGPGWVAGALWGWMAPFDSWSHPAVRQRVKVLLHALSSSSAALHFRCRGRVCNLIPKQSLASVFFVLC